MLFWSFGFPIVLAIALGIAFRNRPPEPPRVAVELGPLANVTAEGLSDSGIDDVQQLDPLEASEALRTGKVDLIVVPTDPPTYRFDPTRPESRLARAIADHGLQRAAGRQDAFVPVEARVTEPGSRYIDFLIPGLIGTGLMQAGLWGVGYVIVEMRSKKLMKRLVATPMKKRDFLLAFVIARALFLVVELPVLVTFATVFFDVPLRGSVVLLFLVATLGSLTFAGIGLLVASRAQNIQTASGLINLASLPMLIASGTFFASSRFPALVQPLVQVLPLTALNDALRAVMLDGAGPVAIGGELLCLCLWGGATFALALKLFKWT